MCPACDAWQHDECWVESKKCATCGFESLQKQEEKKRLYYDKRTNTHVYVDDSGHQRGISDYALNELNKLLGRQFWNNLDVQINEVVNAEEVLAAKARAKKMQREARACMTEARKKIQVTQPKLRSTFYFEALWDPMITLALLILVLVVIITYVTIQ